MDAWNATEQLQAASFSQQEQLPPQHFLGGLQLSCKASSPELLLPPPHENVSATAINVLDQGLAPQEVRDKHRHRILHHLCTIMDTLGALCCKASASSREVSVLTS